MKRNKTQHQALFEARSYDTIVRPTALQLECVVEVKFNGIPRYLLVDTGSSDTWMVNEGFQCIGANGKPAPSSSCGFGDPYTGCADHNKNEPFYLSYGNTETVSGSFGYVDAAVAGLTVEKQQVALVDRAFYLGDRVSSGIIGLGPRTLTSAYPGNDPDKHPIAQVMRYSPIFESMYNRTGLIDPVFSLALERGRNGGYLAFGGLPPIKFDHDFVTSQFVGMRYLGRRRPERYYPIQPQSYLLGGQTYRTSYTAIVDSGTYACRLPTPIADKVNSAFDPPAKYDATTTLYVTSCNATVPKFGIGIGDKMFEMHPTDLFLLPLGGNECATSILRGFPGLESAYPDGFLVLGASFLHNVVAVFDVMNEQIHFAPHSDY